MILRGPGGDEVHAHRAVLRYRLYAFGVCTVSRLWFRPSLDQPASFTLHVPLHHNKAVLRLSASPEACRDATMAWRMRPHVRATAGPLLCRPGDVLEVEVVVAQPYSYRSLFLDWAHLGTDAVPCAVTMQVDLSALPPALRDETRVCVGRQPLADDGAMVLTRNTKVVVHAHTRGFGLVDTIAAPRADAPHVAWVLRPGHHKVGMHWFIKAKHMNADDNVMTLRQLPADDTPPLAAGQDTFDAVCRVIAAKDTATPLVPLPQVTPLAPAAAHAQPQRHATPPAQPPRVEARPTVSCIPVAALVAVAAGTRHRPLRPIGAERQARVMPKPTAGLQPMGWAAPCVVTYRTADAD